MSMEFTLGAELEALQAEAAEVGRRGAEGLAVREDSWLIGTSRAFSLELAERGWLGMTWPVEEGGHGRNPLERFVVFEALIGAGAPVATSWFADRQIGPTLLQFGTPEQRRRFLPDIVAGTSAWSIGMSEPDAGSDVASHPHPGRPRRATTGSSTARRSGPAARPMPTGATSSPAPTPMPHPTRGCPSSIVDLHSCRAWRSCPSPT